MAKKYAAGRRAWGICGRSGRRMLLKDMVFDGQFPNMRVDPDWYEPKHPQENLTKVDDPVALWRPSPEVLDAPTTPVLSGEFVSDALTFGYVLVLVPEQAPTGFRHIQEDQFPNYCNDDGFTGLTPFDRLLCVAASSTNVVMGGQDDTTGEPLIWYSTTGLDHTRLVGDQIWIDDERIRGLAYGNGRFVAIGGTASPQCSTSDDDGLTWVFRGAPTASIPNGVAFLGGIFVTFDQNGFLYTSPDGETWTFRLAASINTQNFAAATNGTRRVLLLDGQVIYSDNGTTWTHQSSSADWPLENTDTFFTQQRFGIAFGAGLWVVVGVHSPTGAPRIMTSTTGIDGWVPRTIPEILEPFTLHEVKFTGTQFIAVAWSGDGAAHYTLTSLDGINWVIADSGFFTSIARPGQAFVTNNALSCAA